MSDLETINRRDFISTNATGLSGLALALWVQQQAVQANPKKPDLVQPTFDTVPKAPHPTTKSFQTRSGPQSRRHRLRDRTSVPRRTHGTLKG